MQAKYFAPQLPPNVSLKAQKKKDSQSVTADWYFEADNFFFISLRADPVG